MNKDTGRIYLKPIKTDNFPIENICEGCRYKTTASLLIDFINSSIAIKHCMHCPFMIKIHNAYHCKLFTRELSPDKFGLFRLRECREIISGETCFGKITPYSMETIKNLSNKQKVVCPNKIESR